MKARLWPRFAAAWRTRRLLITLQPMRSEESHTRLNVSESGLRGSHSCSKPRTKINRRYNLLRFSVLAVCVWTCGVPVAHGWQMHPVQQRPTESAETLDTLAAKLSAAIVDAKENSVIVFDFAGPNEVSGTAEKSLADDFSAALARVSNGFTVGDRARIAEGLQKRNLTHADLDNPHNALGVAKEMKAKAYVWGAITVGRDNFDLLVEVFGVQGGKRIAVFQAKLPVTNQMREESAQRIGKEHDSSLPQAGTRGKTFPSCAYCPPVKYTQSAVWHHFEGTVTLSVIVTADGRANDIQVVTALPYGLTENSIETVRSWRFKPAQNSDGNPAPVVQTIETTFRLN
jgi:TonB family protein